MRFATPLGQPVRTPGWGVTLILVIFLAGLYLGISAKLPGGIPVPAVVAGAAGAMLLLCHLPAAEERHIRSLLAILIINLLAIFSVADFGLLKEHFKGFIQLSYSILISYGFFLAVTFYSRRRLARIFMLFCITILIGCALETYAGLGVISDAFRDRFFETGIYEADQRDQLLYGIVRPKLFTSEPSAVTFIYALFLFAWYATSRARGKVLIFFMMMGAGFFFMRGPTLLLGAATIPFYEVFVASRTEASIGNSRDLGRAAAGFLLAAIILIVAIPFIQTFYAERVDQIVSGQDPSFFSRVIAPPLVAIKIIAAYPIGGVGLTGWESMETISQQVYASAEWFSSDYRFGRAAESITNYFWLHWIFLGIVWGTITFAGLFMMLRALGTPSPVFCLIAWAIFGQGSGSYVGPQTWAVLFLAAALGVVHERDRAMRQYIRAFRHALPSYNPSRREPFLTLPQPTNPA